MIPSKPGQTWLFLAVSLLLFFVPDLLAPKSWLESSLYPIVLSCYQAGLIVLGFGFGPAICRAMVTHEIMAGAPRSSIDRALATLATRGQRLPRVVLAEHDAPFVLTAGLLPWHCQVFVSSALMARLSAAGQSFLLARAGVHASWRQRLAAVLPVLVFTVLLPDMPQGLTDWLVVSGFLLLWLFLHWVFELDADRQAARVVGAEAERGLREVVAATASPIGWLTPHMPLRWRLRAISGQT